MIENNHIIVPLYIKIAFVFGAIAGIYQMIWVRKDGKRNPEKYIKDEEQRVKSFFDVI